MSDDNNGDSQGNNDGTCNDGETIEFYPLLNSITDLNAKYVKGTFSNMDSLHFIEVWDNHPGANGTVYNSSWWNYAFGLPNTIPAGETNMSPEFDFVFDINDSIEHSNFYLYTTLYGGFNLFPDTTVLTLVKWALPYRFNPVGSGMATAVPELQFGLSPNPTNGMLMVNMQQFQPYNTELTIYNVSGQLLKKTACTNAKEIIDMRVFEDGVYFIELKNRNGLSVKRLVLQK
ncbi:MAG: T9SS type A sorting domain-containing protein [Bacteroidetes bacterium]|nr:T9SS type A sorting domain-containing protein [Bacteroidota bacterium]